MLWQEINREVAPRLQGNAALADERPFIVIESRQQRLHLIDIDSANNRSYPVSTAANGMGNFVDSFKTPVGIHRVRQKIGGGQPRGMIFESREPNHRRYQYPCETSTWPTASTGCARPAEPDPILRSIQSPSHLFRNRNTAADSWVKAAPGRR